VRYKSGDEVVVVVGDQEVIGRVSRVTPRGVEVTFDLALPPTAIGSPLGHATWRDGRETVFELEGAQVRATVTVPVDPESPGYEQRAYVRLARRLAVDVATGEGVALATGSTQDLSSEGAKLKLNRGLKKGETVVVALFLEDGPIHAAADVLRQRKQPDGSHEVAVRFRLEAGIDKSRLVRFVFASMRGRSGPQRS
jgi:hypothetical protein